MKKINSINQKNNRTIIVLLASILAVVLILGLMIMFNTNQTNSNNTQEPKEEIVDYFSNKIMSKAIQSIGGQPREGFQPSIFLQAFPKIKEQDFNNVEAAQGFYKYENNQLIYKPIGPQTHSAAYAITEDGYETLLDNLATRFNTELKNKNSVDRIIEKLYEEENSSKELNFRTISKEGNSQMTDKTTKIVKTQQEWRQLWIQTTYYDIEAQNINFDDNMVIAVFQGQKPTGSYEIEITKIIERGNYIEVKVKEVSPGPNCAADTVITSPYHIVEVKKSDKPVRFTFEQEITQCNN